MLHTPTASTPHSSRNTTCRLQAWLQAQMPLAWAGVGKQAGTYPGGPGFSSGGIQWGSTTTTVGRGPCGTLLAEADPGVVAGGRVGAGGGGVPNRRGLAGGVMWVPNSRGLDGGGVLVKRAGARAAAGVGVAGGPPAELGSAAAVRCLLEPTPAQGAVHRGNMRQGGDCSKLGCCRCCCHSTLLRGGLTEDALPVRCGTPAGRSSVADGTSPALLVLHDACWGCCCQPCRHPHCILVSYCCSPCWDAPVVTCLINYAPAHAQVPFSSHAVVPGCSHSTRSPYFSEGRKALERVT
jgi:hypothetical protein